MQGFLWNFGDMLFWILANLESLDKLQVLLAAGNLLISADGLTEVPLVQVLDLSDNQLKNVESIESLGILRVLDLGGNNFKTVSQSDFDWIL